MFRDLGLNEEATDCPGATQSTGLGKELKLDLIMAFVGVWDIWDIPYILVEHGFIEDSQAEELCRDPIVAAERKLSWYVYKAYLLLSLQATSSLNPAAAVQKSNAGSPEHDQWLYGGR